MAYVLDPAAPVPREVRRVARSRLAEAIEILEGLDGADGEHIEEAVHDVRKRCKEVRGLARLVRASLGNEFDRFNSIVRDAADVLAPIREAHAMLATLDELRAARTGRGESGLEHVREVQFAAADQATRSIRSGDERIDAARELLITARKHVKRWQMPDGFAPLGDGLERTYKRGRRALALAIERPTDEHLHEWRKAVKNLWYQTRLLERSARSVLEPATEILDDLSEALGDDHDLAGLVERLATDPHHFGGSRLALHAIDVVRAEQAALRRPAFRLGATIYAEKPKAFVARFEAYWNNAVGEGPELATGGITDVAADAKRHAKAKPAAARPSTVALVPRAQLAT